jgi:hypothetical protein
MRKILLAVGLVLAIMYVVPFPVYGLLSALTGLQPPTEGSATLFLLSVLIIKVGVAVAFVLLYSLARDSWAGRWMLYALIWWLMFAVVEVGQAVTPDYSWLDALGGIVAEAIYFPVAALVVVRLLRPHKAVENRV